MKTSILGKTHAETPDADSKTLVLVCSSLRGGGAERNVVNVAEYWSKSSFNVYILTIGGVKDDMYTVPTGVGRIALDLETEESGIRSSILFNLKRISEIRCVLKDLEPSHVIGFNTTSNILTIIAALGLLSKVIVSERNYPPRTVSGAFWRNMRRITYGFAYSIVTQTQLSKAWILENTFARKVVVIPNSIVWPISTGHGGFFHSPKSFLKPDTKIILAVGNLQYQKGHDILIAAVAKLVDQNKFDNWHLIIAGAGDNSKLNKQIEELEISANVTLIGAVCNVMDWYERADLFVLSSRFEGFPNVLLEAMCSGCCVVSFACPSGPEDIVTHNHDGLLVEPNSVCALTDAIASSMRDPDMRIRLGENASHIQKKYAPSVIMQLWSSILEDHSVKK